MFSSTKEAQDYHINNYRSDGIAKGKGQRYSSDYYRVQFVINNVPKNAYVLEVGCNSGVISVQLNAAGCYVNGIDIVPELVEKAKKNGIIARVGKAEDLSVYVDNLFDCVVCAEVLEHLYDPMIAMREAYRVLRPGGKYVVTVPAPTGQTKGIGDYHQSVFSMEILDTLFHSLFKRGKVKVVGIPYIPEFCQANNVKEDEVQWIGIVAQKS